MACTGGGGYVECILLLDLHLSGRDVRHMACTTKD